METQCRKFLKTYSSIANQATLEEYKRIVRLEMYGASVALILLLIYLALGFVNMFVTGLKGALFLMITGTIMGIFSKFFIVSEKKIRDLPCANENLAKQYQAITETWKKKLFPDF